MRVYLRVELTMDNAQEAAYRADTGVATDEPLRPRLLDHVHEQLAGEGALNGWWDVKIR
jgi:anaerobic glycerol-3-phosphate dehydrogenase